MTNLTEPNDRIAPKPLFRDPIWDGAADPTIIHDYSNGDWVLIYTNRRANVPSLNGVSWVHGTHLGSAVSSDGGVTWTYRGILNLPLGGQDDSHWAPEIVWDHGVYHMYLSFVPGVHEDWSGTREMHHLTSTDLVAWQHISQIDLSSDRVIDACVHRLHDGGWRMWYNNEPDNKAIYYADSPDLYQWTDHGKATGDVPGEGPNVFFWHGYFWMVVDIWRGQAVYRSLDAQNWERQPGLILAEPGIGEDDRVMGGHAKVQVCDDRAYLFYFTHPGRVPENAGRDDIETRRSSIQAVELHLENGWITCDRDVPCKIRLDAR